MSFDFKPLMPAVAARLWGAPRPGATRTEVRFGDGRTINPVKGTWWDHGDEKGGGVLDLIERETGAKGQDAIEWLRKELGADIPDDRPSPRPGDGRGAASKPPAGQPYRNGSDAAPRGSYASLGLPNGAELARTFDYLDEEGRLLFQVCRFEWPDPKRPTGRDKSFRQRKPVEGGGWDWKTAGVRQVPYRLADLREAIADGSVVFVVEGEKAAEALLAFGVPATTNAMGAGKWPKGLEEHFRNADVVILPDNDEPGRKHRDKVAEALLPVAKRVRVLDLPGLPEKGDVVEWLEAGNDVDRLFDLVATSAREPGRAEVFQSRYGALRWEDLDKPGPEHEFLISDFLTIGDKSVVGGPSKSGKSFLSIHAGMSVARGTHFFGRPTKRGLVVYQAGEGARGIKKRLRAYRKHFDVPAGERVPFVLLQSAIDLYRPDGDTGPLIEEIRAITALYPDDPLRLVVIDTLATATGGADENSGRDMGAVMQNIGRINAELNAHVMLVHHMNAGGTKLRGHTSIYANVDQVALVTRDDKTKIRTVVLDKQKDDEDGIRFRFELLSVPIGEREDGRPLTSCVVVDLGEKAEHLAKRAEGFKLEAHEIEPFRALLSALGEYGEQAPSKLQLPLGTRVVTATNWRKEYERISFAGFGEDPGDRKSEEAIRKRLQRAGKTLLKFGVIGRSDAFVWWSGKAVRDFPETFERASDLDWKSLRQPTAEGASPLDDERRIPDAFDFGDDL